MALRRNILIFHQGALGDFVLTWPIALALARIYPQSRVFYVTHSQKGRLAEEVLGVEWADAEAGWHGLFGDGGTPLPDVPGRLLAGAHSVVSFLSSPDSPFVHNVRRLAPEANVLAINPTPPESFGGHAMEFQLRQLAPWPAAHAAAGQILRSIQARGISGARPTDSGHVLIHPGSGSPAKNWPARRFAELGIALREARIPVDVCIGDVEAERWSPAQLSPLAYASPYTHTEDLLSLMNLIRWARAFIGNDSGPAHLAGILGVPTLALFGPTDPARWKPLGPRVEVIRAASLDELSVDDVFKKYQALIGP